MSDSLLPPSATGLAKALDLLEERLFALPVGAITKAPTEVPEGLLAHLAWEMSVDVWDAGWPEETRRAVITASEEVHKYKGTPYAIKSGLAAFGIDAELTEWFEVEGALPGSFEVIGWLSDQNVWHGRRANDQTRRIAQHVVRATSPISRKFKVRLGQSLTAQLYLAGAVKMRCTTIIEPNFPRTDLNMQIGRVVHTRNIQQIGADNG